MYKTRIDGTTTFAWLILPAKGEVQKAEIEMSEAKENSVDVTVAFADGKPETHRLGR